MTMKTIPEAADHVATLLAVARDRSGVPGCTDRALHAAQEAGLVKFSGWPSGHWSLTTVGHEALTQQEAE